ncbi:hypothetical protein BV22DRAFT_1132911 [Leucogyrophana mollusca]|uniref:Uncharacterized protein n=1 Tax=Leucogyrophana mollusca TaxID=85980 RepID=A0ACB8B5D4_9AGAM|nr:hypothetical protein BV22DRAFT_1132911 [Leucogyrophana mollusca]
MITLTIALVLLTLLVIAALAYPDRFIGTKARPDLPGPRDVPLLENLFQLLPHRRHDGTRFSKGSTALAVFKAFPGARSAADSCETFAQDYIVDRLLRAP